MTTEALQALRTRFSTEPMLIHPDHVRTAVQQIAAAQAKPEDPVKAEAIRRGHLSAVYGVNLAAPDKPFAFADGVAVISISGTLIHRCSDSWPGWYTGYDAIRAQMRAAMDDPDVKAAVGDFSTGGGDAAGMFELSEEIASWRGKKPLRAMVDAHAYSAGYGLASAFEKIILTKSGGVGSIGVVTAHVDWSKLLDEVGIKVTMLYAGKHKVDGNPYEPLTKQAREKIMGRINALYSDFVSLVAKNRGLEESVVRGTEAACYGAAEALKLGLVDAVASPREAFTALVSELTGSQFQTNHEESDMSTNDKSAGTDDKASVAEKTSTELAPTAAQQERDRIAAITTCAEAEGRKALAEHFAFKTDMKVVDAKAALAAAPVENKATAATGSSHFAQAMNANNPDVGAGDGGDKGGEKTDAQLADGILADYHKAAGIKSSSQAKH